MFAKKKSIQKKEVDGLYSDPYNFMVKKKQRLHFMLFLFRLHAFLIALVVSVKEAKYFTIICRLQIPYSVNQKYINIKIYKKKNYHYMVL